MHCFNCGKDISDDALFCPYCGVNLKNSEGQSLTPPSIFQNLDDEGEAASREEEKGMDSDIPSKLTLFGESVDDELPKNVGRNFIKDSGLPGSKEDFEKIDSEMKSGRKKRLIIYSASALAVVLAVLISVLYFTSPRQKIMRLIRSDRLDEAIELYNEQLAGKGDKATEDKLTEAVNRNLDKGISRYLEEAAGLEETKKLLLSVKNYSFYNTPEYVKSLINDLKIYEKSRGSFKKGEEFLQKGDYENAMKAFSEVSEKDPLHEKALQQKKYAESKYVEKRFLEFNNLINRQKVEEAERILNEIKRSFPEASGISDAEAKLKKAKEEEKVNAFIRKADEMANKGDILGALQHLKSDGKLSALPSVKASIERMTQKYISDRFAAADYELESGNYSGAIAILEAASSEVPSEEFTDRIEEIKFMMPIRGVDLERSASENYSDGQLSFSDVNGKSYTGENNAAFSGQKNLLGEGKPATVIYNLDGNYSKFTATVVVPKGSSALRSMQLTFRDENGKVLARTEKLVSSSAPFEIELSVEGVDKLEINEDMLGIGTGTHTVYLYDVQFFR